MDSVRFQFLSGSSSSSSPYLSQWTRGECKMFEEAISRVDRTSFTLFEEIKEKLPRKSVTQVAWRYFEEVDHPTSKSQPHSCTKYEDGKELIAVSSDSEVNLQSNNKRVVQKWNQRQRMEKKMEQPNSQTSKRDLDEVEVVFTSLELDKVDQSTYQIDDSNIGDHSLVPGKVQYPSTNMQGLDRDEIVNEVANVSPELERIDKPSHYMANANYEDCSMHIENTCGSSTKKQGMFIEVPVDETDDCFMILEPLPGQRSPDAKLLKWQDLYPKEGTVKLTSRVLPSSTSSHPVIVENFSARTANITSSACQSDMPPPAQPFQRRRRGRQPNSEILPSYVQKLRKQRRKTVKLSATESVINIPDAESSRQHPRNSIPLLIKPEPNVMGSISVDSVQNLTQPTALSVKNEQQFLESDFGVYMQQKSRQRMSLAVKTEPQHLGSVSEVTRPHLIQQELPQLGQQNASVTTHNFMRNSFLPLCPVKVEPEVHLPYAQNSRPTFSAYNHASSSQGFSAVKKEPQSLSHLFSSNFEGQNSSITSRISGQYPSNDQPLLQCSNNSQMFLQHSAIRDGFNTVNGEAVVNYLHQTPKSKFPDRFGVA